ncbi:3-methyladenine DNA glycosylase [Lacticaseibacillus camelliae DSM 22697 = JCM 13995]|uniref:Putative 3-methyladenine DNA glycosylase n=2 Tax=Lacticaseibacillus camelliae TaxID=381742 RepID=A0A0R2F379_9LACO|nr:3-methyladenine DNA glycosylase [Lacticaseibacillus camelliae DSM 22697 = JCM 13995]
MAARGLLGAVLKVGDCAGLVVETEAYLGVSDRAAHAFGGRRTKTNEALYGPAGTVYVYQMRQYCLLNVVTQPATIPQCVLIRAVEPIAGVAAMAMRRGRSGPAMTSGPGKLCQAFGITLADNNRAVNQGRVQLIWPGRTPALIRATPRIGVPNKGTATTAALRFFVAGNANVSDMKKRAIDPNGGWQ